MKAPCVVIATGEVSTKIGPKEKIGLGGPGQELSTSFAISAAKAKGIDVYKIQLHMSSIICRRFILNSPFEDRFISEQVTLAGFLSCLLYTSRCV